MRIALATCRDLPCGTADDIPLRRALDRLDVAWEQPVWDDPAVSWEAFDGVLIRSTWDYMERRGDYVSWAQRVESVTPLFNPASTVRANTHKSYLARLAASGVPIVPTDWLERGAPVDLSAELAVLGATQAILKPQVGATARETIRFTLEPSALADAQRHVDRLLSQEGLMLQPYLESVESRGELSVIFVDGVYSHAVRKFPAKGDYRVQEDFGGSDALSEPSSGERSVAESARESVGEGCLYARIDLLYDRNDRPVVNEVELVEPSLFFRHRPEAAMDLAVSLRARLEDS